MLASRVLNDPEISHLFFVDDDMGFNPSAFFKLLDFDREFAGHICPARHIDLPAQRGSGATRNISRTPGSSGAASSRSPLHLRKSSSYPGTRPPDLRHLEFYTGQILEFTMMAGTVDIMQLHEAIVFAA